MSDGFQKLLIPDTTYGRLEILVVIPKEDDPWGVLRPLRDTVWGSLVREVSGEALAHARHGYAAPLVRELGPDPTVLLKRIPNAEGFCGIASTCAGVTRNCRPGLKMPDCYEAPMLSTGAAGLAWQLATAWRSGIYVVVVVGSEFNLS